MEVNYLESDRDCEYRSEVEHLPHKREVLTPSFSMSGRDGKGRWEGDGSLGTNQQQNIYQQA